MRKIWDIPGGVHPPENKQQSLHDGIGLLPLPDKLILPLNQHIGNPSRPVVSIGEKVLKGQLVAESAGLVSAAIHAPTSGTVDSIGDYQVPHPSGMTTTCIIITPDGLDTWIDHAGLENYLQAEPTLLSNCVREAGITGLGGAGFPTSVKLSPLHPINTLIINGTECEPYITADDILMQERAAEIVEGVKILGRILGDPKNILIGVEDNKARAFDQLEAAAAGSGIEVLEFPTKYPSGGEKQLIQILTGKEVASGKLPADLGIICQNVGTAYAVYRAVALGEPLISRITTVTGKACSINRNYEVLLGTPVSHLLEQNGFDENACTRLVMGGPMMGFNLPGPEVPVIKTTNCILACNVEESPTRAIPAQPCIRCGLCAEACPASLLPQQLYWYSQAKDYDKARAYNLFDCIECGACAYVCPSNIPLVQYYRSTKGEIRKLDAEKRRSDHARERFEFHKTRIEKAEAEKAAKREARRQAALEAQNKATEKQETATPEKTANGGSADDLIKAALARAEAKKASPEHQKGKLERAVVAAKNRLAFAEERLAETISQHGAEEQMEKLRANIEEAKRKLEDAEEKFAKFKAESGEVTSASTVEDKITSKIQGSSGELIENKIVSLKQRIATTREKIAGEQDENVKNALVAGLEKMQGKLQDTEKQLAELGGSSGNPVEDAPALDAAAKAIERAQAKARAMAEMTPVQKLEASIESLTGRIEKARNKLDKAREEESEHVDALTTALAKLEEKLGRAELEKQQLLNANEEKQS